MLIFSLDSRGVSPPGASGVLGVARVGGVVGFCESVVWEVDVCVSFLWEPVAELFCSNFGGSSVFMEYGNRISWMLVLLIVCLRETLDVSECWE